MNQFNIDGLVIKPSYLKFVIYKFQKISKIVCIFIKKKRDDKINICKIATHGSGWFMSKNQLNQKIKLMVEVPG